MRVLGFCKMVFSIVVPVYNVEEYLPACMDSILSATRPDIEVILVNDGSPDGCPEMCDEYAKKDARVKVIHQENAGLSAARNTGIRQATGQYILFVDSDDWIDSDILSELADLIENANEQLDIVFLELVLFYNENNIKSFGEGYIASEINKKPKKNVIKHLAQMPKFQCSACAKLIRTGLIKDNDLYFQDGLLGEDNDWTLSYLKVAEHFAYMQNPFYYYRLNRPGSILHERQVKLLGDRLYIAEKHGNINIEDYEYQAEINSILAFQFVSTLYLYATYKRGVRRVYHARARKLMWLLEYGNGYSYKIALFIYRLFGLNICANVIRFYRWISNPFYQKNARKN